jgi:small subunit ribosomal protein S10e
MVLVSKDNKRVIFTYLLREGVIVVKKDAYLQHHQQVTQFPNLHVMMITKSLKSQGFLNEVYNWGWRYYFLTNEGVAFLIKELGLPVDAKILPATHTKKKVVTKTTVKEGKEGVEGEEEGEAAETAGKDVDA